MKIHIILKLKAGPYGGGNQFLKALKNEFISMGIYVDNPNEADVFLFNSFHDIDSVLDIKRKFPKKIFIHRVDGPISLIRDNKARFIDKIVYLMNNYFADGTIFQTKYSYDSNKILGMKKNNNEAIIFNAPDNSIFYKKTYEDTNFYNRKIKLISTSWSPNVRKGFYDYKYLDEHLDFDKYEFIFIGNSPIEFKNVKIFPPIPSKELASSLRDSDIFITASQKDTCSNSLIEALSCGLPALALNDGGHPELVGTGGLLYNRKEEMISRIDEISQKYDYFVHNIPIFNIKDIAKQYIDLIQKVYIMQQENKYNSKPFNLLKSFIVRFYKLISRLI